MYLLILIPSNNLKQCEFFDKAWDEAKQFFMKKLLKGKEHLVSRNYTDTTGKSVFYILKIMLATCRNKQYKKLMLMKKKSLL